MYILLDKVVKGVMDIFKYFLKQYYFIKNMNY